MWPFGYFVILSDMRSGSNFLEHSLGQARDIVMRGEMFNPMHTVYDIADLDPSAFDDDRIEGFRLFPDHNDAVLARVLDDPQCAKIILRRNPLDRYLSLELAKHSDKWTWVAATQTQEPRVTFDRAAFERLLQQEADYWPPLWDKLRSTGQSPFVLDYDDLTNLDVINGLLTYLGSTEELEQLSTRYKPQNPRAARDKVTNPDEMYAALADLDPWQLEHRAIGAPKFTWPRPKPSAHYWQGASWCPIEGISRPMIGAWLEAHLGPASQSQEAMGAWRFEIAPHPLERAFDVFCDGVLGWGGHDMPSIRARLDRNHDFDLHPLAQAPTPDGMRREFIKFLKFLRLNLKGQTAMAVRAPWIPMVRLFAKAAATRSGSGAADHIPRIVLCEHEAHLRMPSLLGRTDAPIAWRPIEYGAIGKITLSDIYTDEMDTLCAQAYADDYAWLGCGRFAA